MEMKIKKLSLVILSFFIIILELIPYGAVLNFANPEGEAKRVLYSYFSLTPYGYANIGPFLTAILSCILSVLIIIFIFSKKKAFLSAARIISAVSVITSLFPLLLGLSCISVLGVIISLLLALELILLQLIKL